MQLNKKIQSSLFGIFGLLLTCIASASAIGDSPDHQTYRTVSVVVVDRLNGTGHPYDIAIDRVQLHEDLRIAPMACEQQKQGDLSVKAVYTVLSDPSVPSFAGWIFLDRPGQTTWVHPKYMVLFRDCR